MLDATDKIIKHEIGLLNLAEELSNISKACQVMVSPPTGSTIQIRVRGCQR